MKNITILGATGSIGLNTLDVASLHPEKFKIFAISANSNWELMLKLCETHNPAYAVMVEPEAAKELSKRVTSEVIVLSGDQALVQISEHKQTDYVMAGIVGSAGLESVLAAANSGKRVMLANKESLVLAGSLLMKTSQDAGAEIIPVDSEHSAIFQCLQGGSSGLKKIQLTASGGPFLDFPPSKLASVTPEQACKHPNWKMGRKISVDSATMMNKGLEIIEAHFLFSLSRSKIEVVVHPQSVVHSLVCFDDGSTIAQLGLPDMRAAISYALSYPERHLSGVQTLDLTKQKPLEFFPPNFKSFPCLKLAYEALKIGKSLPGTLNAANEVAVASFLSGKVGFLDIAKIIEKTLVKAPTSELDSLSGIVENDRISRQIAKSIIDSSI